MEVSENFLSKFLGEDICNMLICREVLQNDGPVMQQFPNIVHMYLYMLGHLAGKWIYGDLNSTFIFTKYDCKQSTTNRKL